MFMYYNGLKYNNFIDSEKSKDYISFTTMFDYLIIQILNEARTNQNLNYVYVNYLYYEWKIALGAYI